jgi:hypothetical protein
MSSGDVIKHDLRRTTKKKEKKKFFQKVYGLHVYVVLPLYYYNKPESLEGGPFIYCFLVYDKMGNMGW